MGLDEHLLTMFREDFEFHDAAGASHHGAKAVARAEPSETGGFAPPAPPAGYLGTENEAGSLPVVTPQGEIVWLPDAERELKKIPFFVRGKARRNTEAFAAQKGVAAISVETLYEAKAHYAR
jgi:light-independent protochlorophyllide reductase subunit B